MIKKFGKEVNAQLVALGLDKDAQIVPVDKIYVWLTTQLVAKMLAINGSESKSKTWSYNAQILNSVLASITRREQVQLIVDSIEEVNVKEKLVQAQKILEAIK